MFIVTLLLRRFGLIHKNAVFILEKWLGAFWHLQKEHARRCRASSRGPSMFKHSRCGLNFVVGACVSLVGHWRESSPPKWSMPDPRGGPQNALNVFLWGWVKPDPRGSACPHKEDCVHINITVASGPGTY